MSDEKLDVKEAKTEAKKDKQKESFQKLGFGAWLKSKREEKGISLEEISGKTKIQMSQLRELEDGWRGTPPATAFIRGFLVNYARQVSLDENEVLIRYRDEFGGNNPVSKPHANRGVSSGPAVKIIQTPSMGLSPRAKLEDSKDRYFFNSKLVLSVLVILVFIGIISFLFKIGKKNVAEQSEGAPSTSVSEGSIAPELNNTTFIENVAVEKSPTKPEAEGSGKPVLAKKEKVEKKVIPQKVKALDPRKELRIVANDSSWVNIRIDSNSSTAGFQMKKGQSKVYKVKSKVELSISDASAVRVEWDGQKFGKIGSKGELKTIILPSELSKLKKLNP